MLDFVLPILVFVVAPGFALLYCVLAPHRSLQTSSPRRRVLVGFGLLLLFGVTVGAGVALLIPWRSLTQLAAFLGLQATLVWSQRPQTGLEPMQWVGVGLLLIALIAVGLALLGGFGLPSIGGFLSGSPDKADREEFIVSDTSMRLFTEYQRSHANEVTAKIGQNLSEFRTSMTFDISLNAQDSLIQTLCDSVAREQDLTLFKCWMFYPAYKEHLYGTEKRALLVKETPSTVKVVGGANVLYLRSTVTYEMECGESVTGNDHPEVTRWSLPPVEARRLLRLASSSDTPLSLRVHLECPSACFSYGQRPPFQRQDFSLGLYLPKFWSEKTMMSLEYPSAIAIRVRRDNAVYQSLSLGLGDGYERKVTFFDNTGSELETYAHEYYGDEDDRGEYTPCHAQIQKLVTDSESAWDERKYAIFMRCAFGTTDGAELSAPSISLFRVALGLIAAGIGFLLLATNHSSLGAAGFLLVAFAPWAIEIFQRKRLFAPSATISHTSWTGIFEMFAISTYLLLLVAATAYFFTPWGQGDINSPGRVLVAACLILWGIVLDFVALAFTTALALGMGLGYACDGCERPFLVRKESLLFEWLGQYWCVVPQRR